MPKRHHNNKFIMGLLINLSIDVHTVQSSVLLITIMLMAPPTHCIGQTACPQRLRKGSTGQL